MRERGGGGFSQIVEIKGVMRLGLGDCSVARNTLWMKDSRLRMHASSATASRKNMSDSWRVALLPVLLQSTGVASHMGLRVQI